MKKNNGNGKLSRALLLTMITLALMAVVTLQSGTVSAEITETDCLACHIDPTVDPTQHHLLYGLPIQEYSALPFPELNFSGVYDCVGCHNEVFTVLSCLECHVPGTINSATVADGQISIEGSGLAKVAGSDLVYVVNPDLPDETCPTDVVRWTDDSIRADSWRYPDGTYCSQPGDTVVVPCAAAEQQLTSKGKTKPPKPPKPCNGKKCQ